ncbi:MAG: glycine zipper 2TM domain-containing protein [Gammaproteobacteria bacterium]|nr:glycine zipper 2TM domain-containing protein [Gammaproteobacteria bacterium]MDE2250398.1 glycine zipper 2TM domain-containing protein [Gammaproteobacteria bacterium]
MRYRLMVLLPALATLAALSLQAPAYADPPSWASASGERDHDEDRQDDRQGDHEGDHEGDRHEHRDEDRGHQRHRWEERDDRPRYGDDRPWEGRHGYHGYDGDDWDSDYGVVSSGRCNTDAVLGVAGAVTGAIIGNGTARPEDRGIATVFGAIAGGIIGSAVGDSIDDGDRACMGHSFELGRIGRPVVWVNPRSRVAWRVVPLRDVSRECREFEVRRNYRGRLSDRTVVACRRTRGHWEFRDR